MTTVQAAFNARVMARFQAAPSWPTVTGLPGGLPVVFEDRGAAHQIAIRIAQGRDPGQIIVSCTCLGAKGHWREPIEMRPMFPARAAITAWRAWHTRKGIAV